MIDPETFAADARECGVPDYMIDGLLRYLHHGIAPGSFMSAVLSNDLMGALGRADSTNILALPAYGRFLYNHAPSQCYGSPEKFEAWLAHRGLKGLQAA